MEPSDVSPPERTGQGVNLTVQFADMLEKMREHPFQWRVMRIYLGRTSAYGAAARLRGLYAGYEFEAHSHTAGDGMRGSALWGRAKPAGSET